MAKWLAPEKHPDHFRASQVNDPEGGLFRGYLKARDAVNGMSALPRGLIKTGLGLLALPTIVTGALPLAAWLNQRLGIVKTGAHVGGVFAAKAAMPPVLAAILKLFGIGAAAGVGTVTGGIGWGAIGLKALHSIATYESNTWLKMCALAQMQNQSVALTPTCLKSML